MDAMDDVRRMMQRASDGEDVSIEVEEEEYCIEVEEEEY